MSSANPQGTAGTLPANPIKIYRVYLKFNVYSYIIYSTHIEYGIDILASQGIPRIEPENIYLEYSWRHIEYRWAI